MNIFIDHNLSPVLARTLDAYLQSEGLGSASALKDKFPKNAKDTGWIRVLAEENKESGQKWCFFTGDLRIIKNPDEKAALKASDLPGFFFRDGLRRQSLNLQLARIFSVILQIKDKTDWNYDPKRTAPVKHYEIPVKGRLKELTIR